MTWSWDFGDGSGSTDQNPTHTYAADGIYTVYLTVTDANGMSDTTFQDVTAKLERPCVIPTISEDNVFGPRPPHDGTNEDLASGDADGDGIADAGDNCALASNADQLDTDHDLAGDACDVDLDNDGVINASDNCAAEVNSDQVDTDGDAKGDVCDDDIDGDTVPNQADNCALVGNLAQDDRDTNGKGDACDVEGYALAGASPGATRPLDVPAASVASPEAANGLGGLLIAAIAAVVLVALLMVLLVRRRTN